MPGRLGPRFAIEALFLIALAGAAAFADLASKWIVLVMAGGWLVVALLELSTDRIWAAAPPWRRPYYAPVVPPRAEVATGPPSRSPAVEPEPEAELPPEPEPEIEVEVEIEAATIIAPLVEPAAAALPEPEPLPEAEAQPEPEPAEPARPKLEPLEPRQKRRWFGRREREAPATEGPEIEMPKHVRLLPPSERADRSSDEVAELFDLPEREENSQR